MKRTLTGLIFLQILLGCLLLLILLPVISSWIHAPALADLSRLAFAPFCHQLPGRSFALAGVKLAVCARCAGIYLGMFLGIQGIATSAFAKATADRKVARTMMMNKTVLIPILLMAADGFLNWFGIIDTPGWARFLLGLGFGFASGRLLGFGVSDLIEMLGDEREWKTGNIT